MRMNAQDKIKKILDIIKSGKTIYISTATRSTKITPKTLNNWEKSGHTLLKAVGKNMFMASGNKFVCIDYCSIKSA